MLRVRAAVALSRRGFKTFPCAAVEVKNEPILGFKEGSPERKELLKALEGLKGKTEEIPCVVGDEHVWTKDIRYQLSPFNHSHKLAKFCYADKELINKAILASVAARKEWDLKPIQDRAQILFKAADVISGPKRAEILAKTMIGQGKTVVQAEIDAAAELIDFFRFNAKHAIELEKQQPLDVEGSTNTMLYRGLEGFVAAVAPFNFTAIGGNLAGTPALMGNVVLWKPSDTAMSASYAVYKVLRECGMPPNIIQFLPADGQCSETPSPPLSTWQASTSLAASRHSSVCGNKLPRPGHLQDFPSPGRRVRWEEFPLRSQLRGHQERGDGDDTLGLRVRRSEVFGLLQDVRTRQQVAADQTGTSGHSQKHQSGRPCGRLQHLLLRCDR
ncbi:hypothetical protein INR49_001785 [Caranx melampygus]|nr:hypothetical protein INR49_001785 [Caranx melampygus]